MQPTPGFAALVALGNPSAALWRVLGPLSVHPWYVLGVVPLLCGTPSPAWLYFSGAVVLSYAEYLLPSARLPWWAWLSEYGPLYGLLAAGAWRKTLRSTAAPLTVRPT